MRFCWAPCLLRHQLNPFRPHLLALLIGVLFANAATNVVPSSAVRCLTLTPTLFPDLAVLACWVLTPPFRALLLPPGRGKFPTSRMPLSVRSTRPANPFSKVGCVFPTSDDIAAKSPEWRHWAAGRRLEHIRLDKVRAFLKGLTIQQVIDSGYPRSGIVLLQHVYDFKHPGEFRARCVARGDTQHDATVTLTCAPTVTAAPWSVTHQQLRLLSSLQSISLPTTTAAYSRSYSTICASRTETLKYFAYQSECTLGTELASRH
jgi:hypothetical protein